MRSETFRNANQTFEVRLTLGLEEIFLKVFNL